MSTDDDNIVQFTPERADSREKDYRWLKAGIVVMLICSGFFALVEYRNRNSTRNAETAIAYLQEGITPGRSVAEVEEFLISNVVDYVHTDNRTVNGQVQPNQIKILFKDIRVNLLRSDSLLLRVSFDENWIVTETTTHEVVMQP